MHTQAVIEAIARAPYNMGVSGAAWLASKGNVPIVFADGGVVLFECEGLNHYQAHFLLTAHGRKAIEQVRDAFRQMFEQHRAQLIFGLVPTQRRDVKMVARWAGAKSVGNRETPHGRCELFVLSSLMFFKGAN
ncbi:MAG: hypothetical protein C0511_19130 [Hyphomicrobium sp.]|nr:hypothetical protein [Hyphomicrobium sp.]